MRWSDKPYHSLSHELRERFGRKVVKLSLDGGFTCPNRDGTVGIGGCLFCSELGAGEFAGHRGDPIGHQLRSQISLLTPKWPDAAYIAYFQSFSGTYAPAEVLQERYAAALAHPDVVGLAVATRPDALSEEALDVLTRFSRTTFVWVELGLQTIHAPGAALLRRGCDLTVFDDAVGRLAQAGIPVVAHTILGIPGETREAILETMAHLARMKIWGVKLHQLYVQEGTDLATLYGRHPFPLASPEEYIELVIDCLERLPGGTVVHRLTGDGPADTLVAPWWIRDKRAVLNGLLRRMRERGTWQGRLCHQIERIG